MKNVSQPTVQPSVLEELCRTDLAHWKGLTTRVKDPLTARVIVQALDADPYLRKHRIGVYLAASETVKRDQIRYARGRRCGAAVGRVLKLVAQALAKAKQHFAAPMAEPQQACPDVDPLVFPHIVDPFAQAGRKSDELRGAVRSARASPVRTGGAAIDALVFPVIVDPFASGRRIFG